jgi:hypothetical protein
MADKKKVALYFRLVSFQVILSACSPFFRQILRRNPHQHPLLYLKGVKYKELLSVLNFMYQGEVNVAQEELNSFLAVAEDLRVKECCMNLFLNSELIKLMNTVDFLTNIYFVFFLFKFTAIFRA